MCTRTCFCCFGILLELLVWDCSKVSLTPLDGTAVVSTLHLEPFMSADICQLEMSALLHK